MELMVLLVIVVSLLLSKSMHNPALLAGSLFGIYSYILKFASGIDTIPYTIERLSSLADITRRIELQEEDVSEQNNKEDELRSVPYRSIPGIKEDLKISA